MPIFSLLLIVYEKFLRANGKSGLYLTDKLWNEIIPYFGQSGSTFKVEGFLSYGILVNSKHLSKDIILFSNVLNVSIVY